MMAMRVIGNLEPVEINMHGDQLLIRMIRAKNFLQFTIHAAPVSKACQWIVEGKILDMLFRRCELFQVTRE